MREYGFLNKIQHKFSKTPAEQTVMCVHVVTLTNIDFHIIHTYLEISLVTQYAL